MNKVCLCSIVAAGMICGCVSPRVDPRAPAVLSVMERVADWQLANPNLKWEPTLWTQATFYAGALALADLSASPRFHHAMMKMSETSGWKICDYHK